MTEDQGPRTRDQGLMIKDKVTAAEILDNLLFRRQFLLGPTPFAPTPHWSCRSLRHGLTLSTHPDLQVLSESLGDLSVTLLGFAVDALNPVRTDAEVVHSLTEGASDIRTLIALTKSLAGRWAIIYQNRAGTYLFTDPCGFRSVFHYSDGEGFWCGSQPEIIRANHRLSWNTDARLLPFLASQDFARLQSAWIGAQTIYEGCLHLMPNHYLDVGRREQVRFYPVQPISVREPSAVVETAMMLLKNIFAGITARGDVLMALTAGWDTRLLLAASRDVSARIQYWASNLGVLPADHREVRIPSLLAKRLDIGLQVRNPSSHIPGWFVSALSRNVTGARVLPAASVVYADLIAGEERLTVGGEAGELCRNKWDPNCRLNFKTVTTPEIPRIAHGLTVSPFVLQETEKWREAVSVMDDQLNEIILFNWEQIWGNWGAQYRAERDMANDEISPFNCRLWIETVLSSPRQTRCPPDFSFHRELIASMWPEALSVPINPQPRPRVVTIDIAALRQRVRSYVPSPFLSLVRSQASRSSAHGRRRSDRGPGTTNRELRTKNQEP